MPFEDLETVTNENAPPTATLSSGNVRKIA